VRRASAGREEIAKERPPHAAVAGDLEAREALFGRPDRPAILGGQVLDGRPRVVERADVAKLADLANLASVAIALLDPPQGETLRPADVGPVRVDPARLLGVEKRASTGRSRRTMREELGMMAANPVGFDVEHRQSVDAARAAAAATVEACCVKDVKATRASIDLGVQGGERLGVVHLRQRPDGSAAGAKAQPSRSCRDGGNAALPALAKLDQFTCLAQSVHPTFSCRHATEP
jgi:hypothetical protein